MSFIFKTGPQGRHILVDATGRIIANSSSGAAPFVYSFGPEGHPVSVDASGRLLISDPTLSGLADTLANLDDVLLTSPASGQFLQYDGMFWENIDLDLETLSNVSGIAISGQVLHYNGTDWFPSDVILSLDDISNVIEGTPTETDALVYSGSTWIPSGLTPLISSLVPVDSVNGFTGTVVLDIDDINDVTSLSPTSGQLLFYSGSTWINKSGVISDMQDVDTTTGATNDKYLVHNGSFWRASSSTFTDAASALVTYANLAGNGDVGSGIGTVASGNHIHTLAHSSIRDVVIAGAVSGQTLRYDGADWVNDSASAGITIGLEWSFNTSTSNANPGTRRFSLNNTTPASVTSIHINDTTDSNIDASTILTQLVPGDKIYIQQMDNADRAILVTVTGTTDNTGWWTINVTVDSSNMIMQNNRTCMFILSLIGAGHFALTDLSDVNTAGQTETDVLALSGSTWVPSGINFPVTSVNGETGAVDLIVNDISDVVLTSPSSGQIFRYDGSDWINHNNIPFKDLINLENSDFNANLNEVHFIQTSNGQIKGTLPSGHSEGDRVIFKDSEGSGATNRWTIDTADSDTIDGSTTGFTIVSNWVSQTVLSDGSNWFII